MMGRRIRHIKRYREIVTVLVKYGFGYIVRDVGLTHLLSLPKQVAADFSGSGSESKPVGRKICLMCEELGPTFIKLGQMLSLRTDLIPEQIADELRQLQDHVTPVPSETIKEVIKKELGAPAETLFMTFDEHCLAAASIAQVHQAKLQTGEPVVIKIRRPNIDAVITTDIEILTDLVSLLEKHYGWAKDFQLSDVVDEFAKAIRMEMDYEREGRNTDKLNHFFADQSAIIIPKVYWKYSSSQILTLDYINGFKFAQLFDDTSDTFNRRIIAERLVRSFLDQALTAGIFHGDPHPGNLFFFPENKIAYIDFGQVGILSTDMQHEFANLIIGLMKGDINLLFRTIEQMASMPEGLDDRLFKADLELLRDKYYNIPFKEIHIGEVIGDIFEATKKNHIRVPKNFTLLGKALITLEGLISKLDSQISILELAEPYGRKLMLNKLSPEHLSKKLINEFYDFADNSVKIPSLLKKTLTHLNKGKTHVEMELPQLETLLSKLDRVANQISFSIILLAFSIILTGIILGEAFGSHPVLAGFPVLDIAGAIVVFMLLIVLFAILRSGRF
jgi:Predicted unusual protein kinase